MEYSFEPRQGDVKGAFSPEFAPVLEVELGHTITLKNLPDAGWGRWWELEEDRRNEVRQFWPKQPEKENGQAVVGPITLHKVQKGDWIEIRVEKINPASYGFTAAAGWDSPTNRAMGPDITAPAAHIFHAWAIDPATHTATDQFGRKLKLAPFLGTLGLCHGNAPWYAATPPYPTGGNLDCPLLTEGSCLYVRAAIPGGGLYVGDAHGRQGFGEVSGTALEIPLQELQLHIRKPASQPPEIDNCFLKTKDQQWVCFGFHPELNVAAETATRELVDLMANLYHLPRTNCLLYASLLADLKICQIVNGTRAVAASFDPAALALPPTAL